MNLYFCPKCRSASASRDMCPQCGLLRSSGAETYEEKLMETVFSPDPTRVGMAIDVLSTWMNEPRSITPFLMLLQADVDAHRLVMVARGLGWLGDQAAVPALAHLLNDKTKPFVARIAAAKSLALLGGEEARIALQRAANDERLSVAQAAIQALKEI